MVKVGFVSLGCAKNLVDSEVMLGLLSEAGCVITIDPAEAEVIVVNTCGFIDPAKEESINAILEMAAYKESGSCRRLVVAGCLVERYRDRIIEQLPEIDAVVGLDELTRIVDACSGEYPDSSVTRTERSRFLYNHEFKRVLATPGYSAYLKIAEGCNHGCSFCVIPSIRGSFRSRNPDSVLMEAEDLAGRGVRELNLIAQDSTLYGHDLGLNDGLSSLLRDLSGVSGLEWIRFLYTYPNSITDTLLQTVADVPSVCRYIDVPLQHVSSSVLRGMRRGGSPRSCRDLVKRIRDMIPGVSLRTTFIVGFPGETEADFRELLEFVEEAQFDHLGVFAYSDEEGSEAEALGDKIPEALKEERKETLMSLQSRISLARNQAKLGNSFKLLVEGVSDEIDMLWTGRTEGQAPEIDGRVYINDGIDETVKPGDFRKVKISEAFEYDLVGGLE